MGETKMFHVAALTVRTRQIFSCQLDICVRFETLGLS
jgi:hypothetical protein